MYMIYSQKESIRKELLCEIQVHWIRNLCSLEISVGENFTIGNAQIE